MAGLTEKDMATFDDIRDNCLAIFKERPTTDPVAIAFELMNREDVPMHFPFHHLIVPAALLTAAAVSRGDDFEKLEKRLAVAVDRSKNILGGFCGFYGACGASVGTGIFMSIMTDSSPMSTTTWSWCNEATAKTLGKLAELGGPRCCKRSVFGVLTEIVPYANEKLGTTMTLPESVTCTFYERNRECKKTACPFYPKES
ncbi:MAG: DUF5714 domain-containing protein [Lachnospiraceae bacterium]|nr:DUF5714 domain-containing protein [Lachnospiraceae bacterium]